MTTLVLLPGMDGTGDLFDAFIEALGPRIETRVVRYPANAATGYQGLLDIARDQLPTDGDFYLLGESFSGPIAVELAAERPAGLAGLILSCSFVRNPRPALGLLGTLLQRLPAGRPPLTLLHPALLGRFSTPERRAEVQASLDQVGSRTLRSRLVAVGAVDATAALRSVNVPMLYLRATEDRLVPPAACDLIRQARPDLQVVDIVGPHCLLQVSPDAAALAVTAFIELRGLTHDD